MGTSSHIVVKDTNPWRKRQSRYSSKTFKMKFPLMCNNCDRMRRRFVKVGEIKGVPIILCANCVDKMRRNQSKAVV